MVESNERIEHHDCQNGDGFDDLPTALSKAARPKLIFLKNDALC
jgi:hypothetical protein